MATDEDRSRLDLDSYVTYYKGHLLVQRLLTIGQSSHHLAAEALRLAVAEAKKSLDVQSYNKVVSQLHSVVPQDAAGTSDSSWVFATTRRQMLETERLESELKQYKNNLIKESIRMGNEDLGNHYLAIGDYHTAQKCYGRMRENCTTAKHLVEMNLKLLNVAVAQKSWSHAATFGVKLTSLGIKQEDRAAKYDPIINATTGLAHLNLGHYKDAADHFLAVNPAYMTLEPTAGIEWQKEVISPNDIAVYGGLCALATMDSASLKTRVLENQPYRQFLELESHLRRAISMFCSSKFSACLAVLDSYAADYKLDLYLQPQFDALYQSIRRKSMVQWLSAFSRVTFDQIQTAFPAPKRVAAESQHDGAPYSLLGELEELVKSGALNARIDVADQLLVSPTPDPRQVVIAKTLEMAQAQERALRLKLHRMGMLAAGLEVKAPKSQFTSSTFGQPMASDATVAAAVAFGERRAGKEPQGAGGGSSFMV